MAKEAHEKANNRIRQETPNVLPELIQAERQRWHEGNIIRRILNIEAEELIKTLHVQLETCSPDELKTLQGKIIGIRTMQSKNNNQEL